MKLVSNNNIRISQTGGRHQLSFIRYSLYSKQDKSLFKLVGMCTKYCFRFSFEDKDEMEIGCSASSPLGQAEAKFNIEGEKLDTIRQ